MAKKESNTPDDAKTTPTIETPAEEQAASIAPPLEAGGEAPAPEMAAKEAVTLAQAIVRNPIHDVRDRNGVERNGNGVIEQIPGANNKPQMPVTD